MISKTSHRTNEGLQSKSWIKALHCILVMPAKSDNTQRPVFPSVSYRIVAFCKRTSIGLRDSDQRSHEELCTTFVEGTNNKVIMVKHVMHSRCKFLPLKAKLIGRQLEDVYYQRLYGDDPRFTGLTVL